MSSIKNSTPEEDPALREALKRCSLATYYAACKFRKTGCREDLRMVILGVIERFVERDLRPKLATADDSLCLSADLGIDSLTMMEIVMIAEDVLHISVSNEELTHLRTLGEVQRFIMAKAERSSATGRGASASTDDGAWDLTAVGEEVRQIEARSSNAVPRLTT